MTETHTHTQCVYSRTWNNLDFVVVLGALLRGFTHQNLWTSTLADAFRCWRLDWLSLNSKCSSNNLHNIHNFINIHEYNIQISYIIVHPIYLHNLHTTVQRLFTCVLLENWHPSNNRQEFRIEREHIQADLRVPGTGFLRERKRHLFGWWNPLGQRETFPVFRTRMIWTTDLVYFFHHTSKPDDDPCFSQGFRLLYFSWLQLLHPIVYRWILWSAVESY